ncbi:kanamycin kinase [Nonomuraea thailandensis]|uniref:Kanamycin kinase n=1 Tax=Nonomuraea thailandensis TaxID=1188745 RepID=A0A9X2K297_9ACTN|nr:aminoglycoside 3'-phosphotransferase [Nonomuraea thailandensis]MCP2357758.1 kanamycin kinase [Nonomuraea thailandensis]
MSVNSEVPTGPVPVPEVIAALARGESVTPVWRNELGGLTFRLDAPGGATRYAKWVAAGTPEIDLGGEAARLAWAGRWVKVPPVLDHGKDAGGEWLVTAAVPGVSAVDPRWAAEPAVAAAAIGRGLRLLHDALPVAGCPFDWGVERRLRRADERIADGEGPADWAPEHRHLGLAETRARLGDPPPVDRLVVCHGDACVPNTLLHDDGTFAAHVDLGSLGLADRWADLAVAAWSTEYDFGPGHDAHLYEGYGIEPDEERIAYYRLLWDVA